MTFLGEARKKSRLPRVTNGQIAQHADPGCDKCQGKGVVREPVVGLCDCAINEFRQRAASRTLAWGGGLRWTS